jgi:nucleoside-diphosphate-sugar epimerase
MREKQTALVVGATGVAGRALVAHLSGLPDWSVIGVARRRPKLDMQGTFIAVDLADPASAQRVFSGLDHVTHLFYTAYVNAPTWVQQCAPNAALLRNTIQALEPVAKRLKHVCLLQGTKYYGSHLGPFKNPAREDDPRHFPPNFYYEQQDFLSERRRDKSWTWSSARPHTICGRAVGTPLNLISVLGVYAAISRELGLPLRWPGKPGAFRTVYQVCDAHLLARAMTWMSTDPACADQSFNITNGDFIRFEHVWPLLANHFEMEAAPPQQIDLVEFMSDKADVWKRIVERHGLRDLLFADVADWRYANYAFSCDWDIMSSTSKSRKFGFLEFVDSQAMFIRHLRGLAEDRIIPAGRIN